MGPRAVLDVVVKRKIPSHHGESKPITPIDQPVAQSYTDRASKIEKKELFLFVICSGVHNFTFL
jgi:hypothetical protein